MNGDAIVALAGVAVGYPGAERPTLDGVDLTIPRGEFTVIVGASGAGKSTLLRVIAGLAQPLRGGVTYAIEDRRDRRPTAVVFQEPRLLPWRTVRDNVAFGLEGLAIAPAERDRRISRALDLVGLGAFAGRWPHALSGGQRQRVGIARALAVEPALLLMDEPFGALDAITRHALQDELLAIWHATGTSILFVTHDIEEAAYLADRVLLLGGAPAGISETYRIDTPRPRDRGDEGLRRVMLQVRADLGELLQEGGGI